MTNADRSFINSAHRLIENKANEFSSLGLQLTDAYMKRTETDFPIIRFQFTQSETGRQLYLAFSVTTTLNIAGFHSYIDKGNGQNFAIKDWLIKHKEVQIHLDDVSRDPNEFLLCFDSYIGSVQHLASSVLLPYLTSEAWEQVPIDLRYK